MDPLAQIPAELGRALAKDPHRDARAFHSVDGYEMIATLEHNRRRISVEVADRADRIPRNLSLHRSRGGTRRTTIGSPSFDRTIELFAPEAWALAVFTQSTRTLVQVMVERWGAIVEAGTIKLVHGGGGAIPDGEVLRTIRAALELAAVLSISQDRIPDSLAKNASDDPEPHLRERALAALIKHNYDRSIEACRRALLDVEPSIRLLAALSLQADATVEGVLAELATHWGVAPEIRVDAFERFLEIAEDAMPVLERALADPVLAERAVYATVRFSDPSWTDFLAEVAKDCDARLQVAIAIVLADLGHSKAEDLLIAAPTVPVIVERLATIGTARAIPVLKQCGSKEARAAIEQIQTRMGDVQGHVAIVDPQDRRGALGEVEAGRLSLDRDRK